MANPLTQYIRDTRNELKHVAWPTQMQTIVYTALVIAISIGVAAYLGLFDFLFTTALGRVLNVLPEGGSNPAVQISTSSAATTTVETSTTSEQTAPQTTQGAIPF